MKNILTSANKSFILSMSIIAVIGLLWSCTEELYDPGILPPEITEIDPGAAFPGQEIEIIGINFSSAIAGNSVSIGGSSATIISTKTLKITTIIPMGLLPGAADVIVTTNNMPSDAYSFNVTEPVIPVLTSLDPVSGKVGSTVILTGTDFSTSPAENTVSFNGIESTVTDATATTITTTVPAGATTGNVSVTVDGTSNGILFTVIESLTLVVPLAIDEDDAEEGAVNGFVALTSSDLELGEFDTWEGVTGTPQGVQTIGIRFQNITIPPGSTILSATIQFTCDAVGAEPVELTIYGENVGSAAPYDDLVFYNITGRTRTTAKEVWSVPEWVNEGDAGPAQKTVDLSSLLNEIISRGDWASGNNISFIMEPSGPSIGVLFSDGGREAEADVGSDAATITIVYDE